MFECAHIHASTSNRLHFLLHSRNDTCWLSAFWAKSKWIFDALLRFTQKRTLFLSACLCVSVCVYFYLSTGIQSTICVYLIISFTHMLQHCSRHTSKAFECTKNVVFYPNADRTMRKSKRKRFVVFCDIGAAVFRFLYF